MKFKIAVINCKEIRPEIIDETINILNEIAEKYGHEFEYNYISVDPDIKYEDINLFIENNKDKYEKIDAVILGPIKENNISKELLLTLRKKLNLYYDVTPALLHKSLKESSPLKEEIIKNGIDIFIINELNDEIYLKKSDESNISNNISKKDSLNKINEVVSLAFDIARKRNKTVTIVTDNQLPLVESAIEEVYNKYTDININKLSVDNIMVQLTKKPEQFDVILTNSKIADILSKEISIIMGSIEMLPSVTLGKNKIGIYRQRYGINNTLTKGMTNPLATILAAAMMLRYSFSLEKEAEDIENAINKVLSKGYRTADIISEGKILVGTKEMGSLLIRELMSDE